MCKTQSEYEKHLLDVQKCFDCILERITKHANNHATLPCVSSDIDEIFEKCQLLFDYYDFTRVLFDHVAANAEDAVPILKEHSKTKDKFNIYLSQVEQAKNKFLNERKN